MCYYQASRLGCSTMAEVPLPARNNHGTTALSAVEEALAQEEELLASLRRIERAADMMGDEHAQDFVTQYIGYQVRAIAIQEMPSKMHVIILQIKEIAEKMEIRTGIVRVGEEGSGIYLYDAHFLGMMKMAKD